MQRQEIPNNTPEQVRDYLVRTLEIIEELEVPYGLRPAAFEAAFSAISGKQILLAQPQPIDLANLSHSLRR